jgi:hypothetical protein
MIGKIYKIKIFVIIPILLGIMFLNIKIVKAENSFYFEKKSTDNNTLVLDLKINVNTDINASQAIINFDTSKLEVISISKTNSIFNLWVRSPKYDNNKGLISYAAGSIKSFNGSGNILKIKFKIKNFSPTELKFTKGLVLEADGKGTTIIDNKNTVQEI